MTIPAMAPAGKPELCDAAEVADCSEAALMLDGVAVALASAEDEAEVDDEAGPAVFVEAAAALGVVLALVERERKDVLVLGTTVDEGGETSTELVMTSVTVLIRLICVRAPSVPESGESVGSTTCCTIVVVNTSVTRDIFGLQRKNKKQRTKKKEEKIR